MTSAHAKLFEWHRVDLQLRAAREGLTLAASDPTGRAHLEELRRAVRELEEKSAILLSEAEALRRTQRR